MRPIKTGTKSPDEYLKGAFNLPDGVEGGKAFLDGVRGARGLPLRISEAHRDRWTKIYSPAEYNRWK